MPQVFGKLPQTNQPWNTIADVQSVEVDDRYINLDCGDVHLKLSVLSPTLIRVRMAAQGEFLPQRSWAVNQADDQWEKTPFDVEQTDASIEIKTDQIRVKIQRRPCRISYYDANEQPFAQDAEIAMGWRVGQVAAWKTIEVEDHFYGFGERTGLLDKRSQIKTNWTVDALDYTSIDNEMYQAIPFFMVLRPGLIYGIFLNVTYWSEFDLGATKPDVWQMLAHSSELDYYIIYGATPAQILDTYTQLTGRMPLLPKWALGYHQCRWSYESEDVVRRLTKEFRNRKIPCDVIHLDIDYMQGYRVFTWSPTRFPDPAKLIGELQQNGFKTVTIVDPGVKYEPDGEYKIYYEGLQNDYFVRTTDGHLVYGYVWPDKSVFPDFLRPEVRDWWGDRQKILTDAGVAGIWNDMNEPTLDERPFGDSGKKISFPLDAPQGSPQEGGTHAETHNLYGSTMSQAAYQGLEKLRPNQRSFVLTRSGFAGIQRWSSVWMGDNQSLWEHLEMSLPMLCNMALSGVAFVGADIGGFAGNATPELFARWMQMGLLYPLMRGHSALKSLPHEPWAFGDRTEQICRDSIELRYQLLPYLYTLFWQSSNTGSAILRPLLYEYPHDSKTYHLHDQVMLGSVLMAAPVCRPGVEARSVYLPAGVWYDWWSGDRYQGSTHILADAPLERMPLYVKAGSIIPLQPIMQYVDERPIDHLRIRIWPGMGEFTLYEDDGDSFEYRSGAWSTTTYRVQETTVQIEARQGNWKPSDREITVECVGVGEQHFKDDGSARQLQFTPAASN
ncbi:glycoside hydrolase family 31 protein [Phormidesmis sp. 146-12]